MLQSVDLSLVIESAPTAVVVVDGQGRIHLVNALMEELFGYSRQEILGQPVEILLPLQHRAAHPAMRQAFSECPRARAMGSGRDLRARRKDGTEFHVEVGLNPVHVQTGTFIIGAVVDITKRKEAEVQLKAARDQAEAAGRAKGDFLATMSHEIRTPMNGIIGMANMLLSTGLDNDQRDHASTILGSAQSLLTILNDVLDYSRIEAGRLDIDPREFDLLLVAEELVSLLSARAAEKGLELVLRYDPALPRRLVGDAGRIRQVMMNLVGNALKFTERGHVLLDIRGVEASNGDLQMEIVVEDSGIGIPMDKQAILFERFTQADSSTVRRFGGSGLGLAISKRLVELMGGSIGMVSRPGEGSRFSFSLTLPRGGTDGEACRLREKRILVVDRFKRSRDSLVDWLGAQTAGTDGFANGAAALRELSAAALSGNPYHAAIIGSELEDCRGAELARAFASLPELNGIRLIAWTSAGEHQPIETTRAAGFEYQIRRPCRYSSLPRLMEHGTQGARAQAASESTGGARVLLVEDNPVNQRVASYTLMKLGCAVDIASNGREAVERWERGLYDLILMDCQMPEMDGYEATQAIRLQEGSPAHGPKMHIPIVAITASAVPGEREQCHAAGMDDYITKPLVSSEIRASLERWVPSKRA